MLDLLKLAFYKYRQLPLYLIHFVTEQCNLRCRHCFLKKNSAAIENELTAKQIRNFCQSIDSNLYQVALTGGETFLRDDLVDIAKSYLELTPVRILQIASNGLLQDRISKMMAEIVQIDPAKLISLNFSIDGLPEVHDYIRESAGIFEQVVSTYKKLAEFQKKTLNLILNINLTVSKSNENQLVPLYSFLKKKLKAENISITLIRGNPEHESEKDFEINKYKFFCDHVKSEFLKQDFSLNKQDFVRTIVEIQNILARDRIYKTLKKNKFIGPCYAGNLIGVIDSAGHLYPCEFKKYKIADLKKDDFKTAWKKYYSRPERKILKKKCYCTHECFLLVNVLFNLAYFPQIGYYFFKKIIGKIQ